jgi:hypothetical protein
MGLIGFLSVVDVIAVLPVAGVQKQATLMKMML